MTKFLEFGALKSRIVYRSAGCFLQSFLRSFLLTFAMFHDDSGCSYFVHLCSNQVAAMPDEDLRSEAQRKKQSAARNEGLQASLLSLSGFVAPITFVPHSLACRGQLSS